MNKNLLNDITLEVHLQLEKEEKALGLINKILSEFAVACSLVISSLSRLSE